uniref:CPW-WPC domain-containing protein n=1 Tax=viral metagenome TaxID=1070528 RepID=A0A6C0JD30_9ZZZZ
MSVSRKWEDRTKGCLFGYTNKGGICDPPSGYSRGCSYSFNGLKSYNEGEFNNWVNILKNRNCTNVAELGSCPDGWTLKNREGDTDICVSDNSGNNGTCNHTNNNPARFTKGFEKEKWAKETCNTIWKNTEVLKVGEKANIDREAVRKHLESEYTRRENERKKQEELDRKNWEKTQKRIAEERRTENKRREEEKRELERLKNLEERRVNQGNVTAPPFSEDLVRTDINELNNKIEMLINDINNIETDLGTCPDGWVLEKTDKNRNYCNSEGSGNYSRRCGKKGWFSEKNEESKKNWSTRCRAQFTNKTNLKVGQRAPNYYNRGQELRKMYNKLKTLVTLRNTLLSGMIDDYNTDTKLLGDKGIHLDKSTLLVKNQESEIDRNEGKLDNINSDILTLRREIQIGENDFKEKSFIAFFLKNVFIFLLVAILIALLVKNQTIESNTGIIAGIVVSSVLLLVCLYNYVIYSNRNVNIFHKRDWVKPVHEEQ